MRVAGFLAVLVGCVSGGCTDAAEQPYRGCEAAAANGNIKEAFKLCEQAAAASRRSKYGKLATERLETLRPAYETALAAEAQAKVAQDPVVAEAVAAVAAERAKALRAKIRKKYWGSEPDAHCAGKGLPPFKWTYEGGTYSENAELAISEGCAAAHTYAENTTFCCPAKPVAW